MASCTCGTCHANCDGSGSKSGCTCVSGCGSGCESCSDSCGNGCKNTCSGDCDGTCKGGCSTSCNDTCKGTCSKSCKGDCDGGCTSCDGGCSGGCSGCSGGCDGCSGGCTSCSNACSSQDMRNAISNLGANIIAKGYIKAEDYLEIKNRLSQELKRRGKQSLDENFTNVPVKDGYTIPEHILRTYNAIYKFNPSYDYRSKAYSGAVIYIDDMDDVIYYIRQLLAQHIK